MAAANEGAQRGGARSVGFGIQVPFETGLNGYVEPELAFTFRYFMTRKMAMASRASALIFAPGGFGTCDELFEMLTLKQTGRIRPDVPVVLFDAAFWKSVINWPAFVAADVVSARDIAALVFVDSVEEAFDAVVRGVEARERACQDTAV